MNKDTEKTKVIFRKFRNGEVIALFPELYEYNNCCSSYMHVGQHGAASYNLVQDTALAVEAEYKPLFDELEELGYNLQVYKRLTQKMHRVAEREYLKQLYNMFTPSVPTAC